MRLLVKSEGGGGFGGGTGFGVGVSLPHERFALTVSSELGRCRQRFILLTASLAAADAGYAVIFCRHRNRR